LSASNCKTELIRPNFKRDYTLWTVREVLEKFDINAFHPEVENLDNNKYLHKMASWINRFNSIRSRLKCSKCETPFKVDLNYSKFSRKFSTTIFDCPTNEDDHDKKIYLNACWGCGEIIDSRESRIRVENYYICKNCGSGPQITYDYTQGDICPNCGKKEMKKSGYRDMTCDNCNHTIKLPFKNKIRGKNRDKLIEKAFR
jgi:DNA-directed RNA polymerase subunit RPC12/RpoP